MSLALYDVYLPLILGERLNNLEPAEYNPYVVIRLTHVTYPQVNPVCQDSRGSPY